MHQVVTTGVERTSFVFFYYPNFDAKLPAAAAGSSSVCAGTRDNSGPGEETSPGFVATAPAALPSPPATEVETDVMVPEENRAEASAGAGGASSTPASSGGIGPYNTLLDLKGRDASNIGTGGGGGGGSSTAGADDESFGQYLLRKWGAVFRE